VKHSLYLSYDGMTDPLGQSQVLPYLKGLESLMHFRIISFEKQAKFDSEKDIISGLIAGTHIEWLPQKYHKFPPVLSTLYDLYRMQRVAEKQYRKQAYQVVHCRSHLTAVVGLNLKRKFGVKLIFDMRSFYPDERAEGGLWPQSKWLYRVIYKYFKKKELQFLQNADHTIVLTQAAEKIIGSWPQFLANKPAMTVIPCMVDQKHFSRDKVQQDLRQKFVSEFKLDGNEILLSYLGSVGTWYMLEEMLQFFKALKKQKPKSKFLFITPDKPEVILNNARRLGLKDEDFIFKYGKRVEVPTLLSLSQLSLFFILPSFSKQASSPTKQGEIMSMGIPVICNSGVGDSDAIILDTGAGSLVKEFTDKGYEQAIASIEQLLKADPAKIRAGASKYYSLDEGIARYKNVYTQLLGELR
jgi:glycosyltransferase involved in cell wall biosynthesis